MIMVTFQINIDNECKVSIISSIIGYILWPSDSAPRIRKKLVSIYLP